MNQPFQRTTLPLLLLNCALAAVCSADSTLSLPAPVPVTIAIATPAPTPPPPPVTTKLAPGLYLKTMGITMPDGPVQTYMVRAKAHLWHLHVAPAGPSVLQRATVSMIAANLRAPVAVNGGYFAFEGAAVGAVKINGRWLRLPWKNRTALGIRSNGTLLIDSLHATAFANLGMERPIPLDNLNGYPSPHTLCLLTSDFGSSYTLKPNQTALQVNGSKLTAIRSDGDITIPADGWVLVGSDEQRAYFEHAKTGQIASWHVACMPAAWGWCPTIVGAGPRLIEHGKVYVTAAEEEFKPDVLHRGPRTAIGIDDKFNPVIFVVDGRGASVGLTLDDLATQMQKAGVVDALSMDGGSSTALVVNGKVVNLPSMGSEQHVSNAILLEPAPPEPRNPRIQRPVPHRRNSVPKVKTKKR